MRGVYTADQVRRAEEPLLSSLGEGTLMRRAATGLEVACVRLLAGERGLVTGASVVLLVGQGNNGGDALWAGAGLARRGVQVLAVALGEGVHEEGLAALLVNGGRVVTVDQALETIERADLLIDGIVGIGGRGALREPATTLVAAAHRSGALIVACDLPSGIDANTGAVADRDAVVKADVTVTFGALKAGTLLMPAAEFVGVLDLVDIGLEPHLDDEPFALVLDADDVATQLPRPGIRDHKYSRGVVVVDAGSARYPGAGVLVAGAARHGGAGLIHYAGGAPEGVAARYPDIVIGDGTDARATAVVVGPGLAPGAGAPALLYSEAPLLVDATALREIGAGGDWAAAVRARADSRQITVMTPHDGELVALGGSSELLTSDRVTAARQVAADRGAIVLLKGATTVVAAPGGRVWIAPLAPPVLATAGSGDVLAGLAGSWLAASSARALEVTGNGLTIDQAAEVMACAAWLHALCGRLASADGAPVAALDLVTALPDAVARIAGAR